MKKLDYLLEFCGDFHRENQGLDMEERGLRISLHHAACDQDPVGSLPADDTELARLAGITPKKLKALKPRVLKGWIRQGRRLVNESIQKQYTNMVEQKAKRSRAGQAGNDKRWHGEETDPIAIALRSDCDPNAIHLGSPSSPSSPPPSAKENTHTLLKKEGERVSFSMNQEPEAEQIQPHKKQSTWSADVAQAASDGFMAIYPKKVGTGDVESWFRNNPTPLSTQRDMVLAIERQAKTGAWIKDDGRWIPQPITWLKGKRWRDKGITIKPRLAL